MKQVGQLYGVGINNEKLLEYYNASDTKQGMCVSTTMGEDESGKLEEEALMLWLHQCRGVS